MSTAQLAARTGVSAGTLRMWESRHGFPRPARLPGGHRRYSERDVAQVAEVSRLRAEGLSMAAAIERVRHGARPLPASVFAGLRERHPEVAPARLPKRAVLGLTHALEDEYCARAADGVMIGCFQRERYYRGAARRWTEFARTAQLSVAVADFAELRHPVAGPIEVPLSTDQALAREWTLVIDAPGARACLAAWEHVTDAPRPDPEREFEVLWSFEPTVVRAATDVAVDVLAQFAPSVAEQIPALLAPVSGTVSPELRFAASLTHRMVGYLGALVGPGARSDAQD